MRTAPNHWLSIVVLSAILGWILSIQGRAAAADGQPAAPRAGRAGLPLASRSARAERASLGSASRSARAERASLGSASRSAPGSPVRDNQAPSSTPKTVPSGRPQTTRPVQAPPLLAPTPTPAPGNAVAVISTPLGDITIELFNDRAPVSVANFLEYANEGFFDETIFHRVRPGFMIQGGGFTTTLTEKPTRGPIQNEATNGLRNTRGTVAMARRAQLRSATSQFYINVADNRSLDHTGFSPDDFGYAVFGRVLSGMDVADRIAAVPTKTAGDMEDVPVEPVIIKSVRVQK